MSEPDDCPFRATMDEVLLEVEQFAYEARHAENDLMLKFHMQMASRALRCALQIYIDWYSGAVPRTKE